MDALIETVQQCRDNERHTEHLCYILSQGFHRKMPRHTPLWFAIPAFNAIIAAVPRQAARTCVYRCCYDRGERYSGWLKGRVARIGKRGFREKALDVGALTVAVVTGSGHRRQLVLSGLTHARSDRASRWSN